MPLTSRSLTVWLTQSVGALVLPHGLLSTELPTSFTSCTTFELSCLALLKVLLTTSFNFILYNTSAMISYYFVVPNYKSKLSCHAMGLILLSKHISAILDCSSAASAPQLLLLLFALFKSQQKSWLRSPALINIATTNIPSLGTNWHGLSPAEVGNKLILWRCLPLKQFLVSWKDNLSILLLKKL